MMTMRSVATPPWPWRRVLIGIAAAGGTGLIWAVATGYARPSPSHRVGGVSSRASQDPDSSAR
jgi:hypothetical protein